MVKNYNINLPSETKIILWKKKNKTNTNIYLIKLNKKFKLTFWETNVKIDKWTNSIIFEKNENYLYKSNIKNNFEKFFNSWNLFYFNKIKFKGKGFRIKFFKKIKLIKFYFGRSHKTFILLKKTLKKRINKYKFILMGLNKNKILIISKKITNIKKINKYTLRGLRLSRQIIYKRKGKKGTYI